jgi:hypothetical protein
LASFEVEGISDGATLMASVESIRFEVLSDINAEFEPIAAPVE